MMAVPFGKMTRKVVDNEAQDYEIRDMLRSFAKVMFDNPSKIFNGQCGRRNLFQLLDSLSDLTKFTADGCQPLEMLVFRIFGKHAQLQLIIIPFFFQLCQQRNLFTA